MKSRILTRYEIFTNGESHGIGFIRGLEDTGISEDVKSNLLKVFNKELQMHPNDMFQNALIHKGKVNLELLISYMKNGYNGKKVVSYFTEKGLEKFRRQIQAIVKVVKYELDCEYTIGEIILDKNDDLVIYEDEYQVIQISEDLYDITKAVLYEYNENGIYSILENEVDENDMPFTKFSLIENKEASNVKPDITIHPFYGEGSLRYQIDKENKLLKITSSRSY